jgi:5-methylcytosine-specific restriction protein A
MRSRLRSQTSHFKKVGVRLGSAVWRGQLYEAGEVVSIEYQALALPPEEQLVEDLEEALRLYKLVDNAGAWWAEDEILQEAKNDGRPGDLEQAKRYRQHRSIERKSSHSKKVKKAQGLRCRGCDWRMDELYGPAAAGVIEAHHLIPLAALVDGQIARFDPNKDFVVLCPNCHAIIHRLPDVGDLAALHAALRMAGKMPSRSKATNN